MLSRFVSRAVRLANPTSITIAVLAFPFFGYDWQCNNNDCNKIVAPSSGYNVALGRGAHAECVTSPVGVPWPKRWLPYFNLTCPDRVGGDPPTGNPQRLDPAERRLP